ncbi:MAG TPA: threonine synthase [Pyrinomonadaceae bacterium]|nr:threonine synthase [Pyrinomonadaceae bacterium]
MHYFSTNGNTPPATFREAVERGQASDGGLFFPSEIPTFTSGFLSTLVDRSNADIAFEMIRPYVGGEIGDAELHQICVETVEFPFPLVDITPDISALELFHGPTFAFKDVGARFMSRCLRHFSTKDSAKTLVVVATSGDTGGAVGAGFHGVDGVEVVILYPEGRVSRIQELQLTTLGENVTALKVRGSFDDCQRIAKRTLADDEIRSRAKLTSANSINIGRWLSQQFYFAFAIKQWRHDEPPVFSVPSGNFGNIAAGLLAVESGLPASAFVAACNANDVVPRFMNDGMFEPRTSVATLSNAMDVGDPSNFSRVLEIFDHDRSNIAKTMTAVSITDAETESTMKQVYESSSYVLDPHGAVAYRALADHLEKKPGARGIFLATAHPIKFECTERIVGDNIPVPGSVKDLIGRSEFVREVDADYDKVKEILLRVI